MTLASSDRDLSKARVYPGSAPLGGGKDLLLLRRIDHGVYKGVPGVEGVGSGDYKGEIRSTLV